MGEKMNMQTENISEKNIELISRIFPGCISEYSDDKGIIKKGINFGLLCQQLSDYVIEGDEYYGLNWVGKKQAIVDANAPIRKTLRPKMEKAKSGKRQRIYILKVIILKH